MIIDINCISLNHSGVFRLGSYTYNSEYIGISDILYENEIINSDSFPVNYYKASGGWHNSLLGDGTYILDYVHSDSCNPNKGVICHDEEWCLEHPDEPCCYYKDCPEDVFYCFGEKFTSELYDFQFTNDGQITGCLDSQDRFLFDSFKTTSKLGTPYYQIDTSLSCPCGGLSLENGRPCDSFDESVVVYDGSDYVVDDIIFGLFSPCYVYDYSFVPDYPLVDSIESKLGFPNNMQNPFVDFDFVFNVSDFANLGYFGNGSHVQFCFEIVNNNYNIIYSEIVCEFIVFNNQWFVISHDFSISGVKHIVDGSVDIVDFYNDGVVVSPHSHNINIFSARFIRFYCNLINAVLGDDDNMTDEQVTRICNSINCVCDTLKDINDDTTDIYNGLVGLNNSFDLGQGAVSFGRAVFDGIDDLKDELTDIYNNMVSFYNAFVRAFNANTNGTGSVFKIGSGNSEKSFCRVFVNAFNRASSGDGSVLKDSTDTITFWGAFADAFNRTLGVGSVFKDGYVLNNCFIDFFHKAFFKDNPFDYNNDGYSQSSFNFSVNNGVADLLKKAFFFNSLDLTNVNQEDSAFVKDGDLTYKLLYSGCDGNPKFLKWCNGEKPSDTINVTNNVPVPSVNVTNNVPVPSVNVSNNVPVPSVTVNNDIDDIQLEADFTPNIKNYLQLNTYSDAVIESNNWSYSGRSKYDFFEES